MRQDLSSSRVTLRELQHVTLAGKASASLGGRCEGLRGPLVLGGEATHRARLVSEPNGHAVCLSREGSTEPREMLRWQLVVASSKQVHSARRHVTSRVPVASPSVGAQDLTWTQVRSGPWHARPPKSVRSSAVPSGFAAPTLSHGCKARHSFPARVSNRAARAGTSTSLFWSAAFSCSYPRGRSGRSDHLV